MTTTTFVDEVTVIEASWLNDVNADVYGVRPVATGGTGATDAADARTNLGLGNVDNTSDANKPVSTAQQAALNLKANLVSPSFTTPSLGVATATSLQGIIGNITPAAGTFTTLTSTGNAALGDAEASDTHAIKGATTLLANSASAALTVTQTGAGNAFVVEDSASDSSPFVVGADGKVAIGTTTAVENLNILSSTRNFVELTRASSNTGQSVLSFRKARGDLTTPTVVSSGDASGSLNAYGYDGSAYVQLGAIDFSVDGTPGASDMPGRIVFSTTADGASSPTERMRIDSAGNVGIGGAAQAFSRLELAGTFPSSSAVTFAAHASGAIPSGTTNTARMFSTTPSTQAAAFTCSNFQHYCAEQGTIGAGSAVTNQYGFFATSTLTGAANNYGFFSNIAAAANRYNFYAAGTADNHFAGSVGVGGTANSRTKLGVQGTYPATSGVGIGIGLLGNVDPSTATAAYYCVYSSPTVAAGTLPELNYNFVAQGVFTGTVASQSAFKVDNTLVGATNNYGFYSNIAAATGRWNFYAAGTAANYFAGDVQLGKTVTAGGTTGAQTINKTVGTVNFAAAATSLVVTNSLVTANSIITATVGTNDTTMKSVAVVAAAGSFTLHANAAATAETRVNFHVFN